MINDLGETEAGRRARVAGVDDLDHDQLWGARALAGPHTTPALQAPGRSYRVWKRAIDIVVSALALVALSPVIVGIALMIKLDDRGPVIFGQLRTGRGGRRFRMLKFRTMCVDAEGMKESLRVLSVVSYPDFKLVDDPRLTRVGPFLRRSHLDELPQLLNVLRGEMTLVGPRPTHFSSASYDLWHTERLDVTPGIAGVWQNRRHYGTSSFDDRVRLDLEYLRQRRTVAADLRILVGSLARALRGDGR